MKSIRSFIVELGISAVIVVIIFLVVWEGFRKVVLIEPIEIPKRFVDAGYTPHVVASQLMGNLLAIYKSVKMLRPTLAIATTRPDIVVPGTGLTIRTITGYLQSIIYDPTNRIIGEVTEQNGVLQFHIRINGRRVDIPEPSHRELDALLTQAIYAVLREIDHYVLAAYLLYTDREAARKEVVQIIAAAPEKSEQKARAYNLYGMILDEDKQFDEAIDTFNKSLLINRRAPYVFLNLGNALYRKGEGAEAIKNLRTAIKLDPTFAPAYSNLGTFLHVLRVDSTEAIKNLRKAIELDPKTGSAYNSLGNVLKDLGEHDEAIKNYRKAIELNPTLASAYKNLGNAYLLRGDREQAEVMFRKALPLFQEIGATLEITQIQEVLRTLRAKDSP
jgi:Flp pilus assembly protein TadD